MKSTKNWKASVPSQSTRWLVIFGLITFFVLTWGFSGAALAQSPTPVPTIDSHSQHHPTATPNAPAVATGTPTMSGMDMSGMMETTSTPPPGGMNMGHNMNPIDPSGAVIAPSDAKGGTPLDSANVNGVREFKLTVQKTIWHLLPGKDVVAYTYNGVVPGPEIRVTEGEKIRILVTNHLSEPTSIHWHGLHLPNDQDGSADVTQPAIKPGETYTYEWTVPNTPGTYFYHSHANADTQQALGLYAPLIVVPKNPAEKYDVEYTVMPGEWTVKDGQTYPAMDMEGRLPNYFTLNGHSFPATDVVTVKQGQRILLRVIGSGQFVHPLHLHGFSFKVVATDGNPVPTAAQLTKDTILVGPGERYDLEFTANTTGKWLFHCHILHHTTNDGQETNGGGGMVMVFNVIP